MSLAKRQQRKPDRREVWSNGTQQQGREASWQSSHGVLSKKKSWLMEEFKREVALWMIRGSLLPVRAAEGTRKVLAWKGKR